MNYADTIIKLGELAAVTSTAVAIANIFSNAKRDGEAEDIALKSKDKDECDSISEHDRFMEVYEFMDEMFDDMQGIEKKCNECSVKLEQIEARIEDANIRLDNIMGGK